MAHAAPSLLYIPCNPYWNTSSPDCIHDLNLLEAMTEDVIPEFRNQLISLINNARLPDGRIRPQGLRNEAAAISTLVEQALDDLSSDLSARQQAIHNVLEQRNGEHDFLMHECIDRALRLSV